MKQFQSTIIRNTRICADFYEMVFSWDASAGAPLPGQFLTVRVSGDTVPLLRRPFAFAGYDEGAGRGAIIYQVRGKGTEMMAEMAAGAAIDVIGPLGVPFPIDDDPKLAIAVAGGIGVGPILFLSAILKKRGVDTMFVFGCRSDQYIPDTKAFQDASPRICTDDGSAGFAGTVVGYIESNINVNTNIDNDTNNSTVIYACGPHPMLKALCESSQSSNVKKTWVSLEAMMACGVGACMGCAIPTIGGYRCVCKDGPVFDGREILWDQL